MYQRRKRRTDGGLRARQVWVSLLRMKAVLTPYRQKEWNHRKGKNADTRLKKLLKQGPRKLRGVTVHRWS